MSTIALPFNTIIGTLKLGPGSNTTGAINVSLYSMNWITDVRSSSTAVYVTHLSTGFLRISTRGIPLVCVQGFSVTLNKECQNSSLHLYRLLQRSSRTSPMLRLRSGRRQRKRLYRRRVSSSRLCGRSTVMWRLQRGVSRGGQIILTHRTHRPGCQKVIERCLLVLALLAALALLLLAALALLLLLASLATLAVSLALATLLCRRTGARECRGSHF